MLIRPCPISQRERTPHALAFAGCVVHTTFYIGGQLYGIVFRHSLQDSLQNNALWGIRNAFRCVEHLNAVLFTAVFVKSNFLPVAPKAINFPDNDCLKLVLCCVLQHLLELFPVIIPARLRPVDILVNDGVAVFSSVLVGGGQLPLNGLLPLLVAGVSGVDNGVHRSFPPVRGGRSSAMRTMAFSFGAAWS